MLILLFCLQCLQTSLGNMSFDEGGYRNKRLDPNLVEDNKSFGASRTLYGCENGYGDGYEKRTN